MPIPISLEFSCCRLKRSCCFYIFDGEKQENFQRAFAIFDYLGAPIQESIKQNFATSKSDEAFCTITIEPETITQASVEISNLERIAVENIVDLLGVEFLHKGSLELQRIALHLDKKGMSLIKYTDI